MGSSMLHTQCFQPTSDIVEGLESCNKPNNPTIISSIHLITFVLVRKLGDTLSLCLDMFCV